MSVAPQSRARQAGLLPGDFIMSVGGASFLEGMRQWRPAPAPLQGTRRPAGGGHATRVPRCAGIVWSDAAEHGGSVGLSVRRRTAPTQPPAPEWRFDAGTAAMDPVATFHGARGVLRLRGTFSNIQMTSHWGILKYDAHDSRTHSVHERTSRGEWRASAPPPATPSKWGWAEPKG